MILFWIDVLQQKIKANKVTQIFVSDWTLLNATHMETYSYMDHATKVCVNYTLSKFGSWVTKSRNFWETEKVTFGVVLFGEETFQLRDVGVFQNRW